MEPMTVKRITDSGLNVVLTEIEPGETFVTINGKWLRIFVSLERILAAWYNWQIKGMLIQTAFYMLNNGEREFLLSGTTPEEWDRMFQDKEDNTD